MRSTRDVFVTGGTGYIGRRLVAALLARGHRVSTLARTASVGRVPVGAHRVIGDALDGASYAGSIPSGCTFVHLIGTPHPSPAKAAEFERVDLASIRAAAGAALRAGVAHFIYVSVAQPAPVMQAYLAVRAEGERLLAASGLPTTLVRPWYVLGPGHWWPLVLVPAYALGEMLAATRASARRLGLVSISQMVIALVHAVERPPSSAQPRIVDVPAIRSARLD